MRHARYRGRHRRPTTSKRLMTSVGAAGVGTVAATVLAPAGAAHAATDVQWDRVAKCESGDNWHINTGNGYYGGLQFAASTWRSYDVDKFASRADLASRAQQITVANRVLASQGWHAWPVCSRDAGAPGPADVNHTHSPHAHRATGHGKSVAQLGGSWEHYRVRGGDSLSRIASRKQVKGGWIAVYRANRHKIGSNPSLLHIGVLLRVEAHTA
jgi:Transglycosylase-like domain